jgi:hypothetical protein
MRSDVTASMTVVIIVFLVLYEMEAAGRSKTAVFLMSALHPVLLADSDMAVCGPYLIYVDVCMILGMERGAVLGHSQYLHW